MSGQEETTSDRRRPKRRYNRRKSPKKTATTETAAAAAPAAPRAPRVVIPIPAELFNKPASGVVSEVITRGRGRFGFINIGDTQAGSRETPRIYFHFSEFKETDFRPRRGYLVEFHVNRDETDRAFASDVTLTAEGRVAAAERSARAEAQRAAAPAPAAAPAEPRAKKAAAPAAAAPAPAERKPREPRERVEGEAREPRKRRERRTNPEDDRSIDLRVTCQGFAETKVVTAVISQSIGKLKHSATEAFGAPIEYNIFSAPNAEFPLGQFLTKAILRTLSNNDAVHLRANTEA